MPWTQNYSSLENRGNISLSAVSEYIASCDPNVPDLFWESGTDMNNKETVNSGYCSEVSFKSENSQEENTLLMFEGLEDSYMKEPQEKKMLLDIEGNYRSAAARRVQSRRSFHRPKPLHHPKLQKLASLPASCHVPPHSLEQEETQLMIETFRVEKILKTESNHKPNSTESSTKTCPKSPPMGFGNTSTDSSFTTDFPGEPVPVLDNLLIEKIFPNIQSKPPLVQLDALSCHPIISYLEKETYTCLAQ
ncbi:hypothetical protein TURU_066015 [Turdus rufiventris]|nr:hypothetical protein TURU_066015 [Turdus rufiventris]